MASCTSALSIVAGIAASLAFTSACGVVDDLREQFTPDIVQADVSGPPVPPDPELGDASTGSDAQLPPTPTADLAFTSIEPAIAEPAGGIDVLLRGDGFRDGVYVLFGAVVAPDVFVVDARTLIVRVPPHPPGRVDVLVGHPELNRGEPIVLPNAFTYNSRRSVTSVQPSELPRDGGVPVEIRGHGFDADTRVAFGSRLAIAQRVVDANTMTAVAPGGDFGWTSIHLAHPDGFSTLEQAVFHYEAPVIFSADPLWYQSFPDGAPFVLHGRGLVADAEVRIGDTPATVLAASVDGTSMTVATPPFTDAGTGPLPLTVTTRWGSARLVDGLLPSQPAANCTTLTPTTASTVGGDALTIACNTTRFDPRRPASLMVLVGARPATIVAQTTTGITITNPGGQAGPTRLVILNEAGTVADLPLTLVAPPGALRLDAVTPNRGPPAGGTAIELVGSGFTTNTAVRIGALPAPSVRRISGERLAVTTPPGSPGPAAITLAQDGRISTFPDAFEYASGTELDVFALDPPLVAQPGGTRVALYGLGFDPTMRVTIGGVSCPIIDQPSGAAVIVRSPRLDPGPHDLVVTRDAARVVRLGAITAYDPRSGFGGTWGGPVAGTLNATVYGSNGHGPIVGAHVIIGTDPTTPWQGFTDDRGQVSISWPDLSGPLSVTASATGFSAASVVDFDARNVTFTLQMNPIPPPPSEGEGGGDPPPEPLPNATLSGRVIGLDKYVLAPPGSCQSLVSEELADCMSCNDTGPDACGSPDHACVSLPGDGLRCLRACTTDASCPAGFRCGATSDGARCIPSPGERAAFCNVTSTSVFGYNYPIQPTGWVDAGGRYTIGSQRLGDMAVYCFGGYRQDNGTFVPTVLGLRRQVFAAPGATLDNLDVELKHPLRRSFRVRLADPPLAQLGLAPPAISVSLYLGADGAIGFNRDPQQAPQLEPDTWILPRHLAALNGDLYDASYVFYTTLAPNGSTGGQPRSYNLVQNIRRIVEDRLPVRDSDGVWRLEGTQLERSLYGLWRGPDDRLIAVGEQGTILLRTSQGWTRQTSPTERTLRAIDGLNNEDIWAVGEVGTVLRRDGLRWQTVPGPDDDLGAVVVTSTHVIASGRLRLRVLDRATGVWSVGGGPGVTGLVGLLRLADDHVLAFGLAGQLWSWTPAETRFLGQIGTATWRAGVVLEPLENQRRIALVGDGGAMAEVVLDGTDVRHEIIASPTTSDLAAVAVGPGGQVLAVGDKGAVVAWQPGTTPRLEHIEDYRSKAHGIAVLGDGTARVVGNASFILGPFLAFPAMSEPTAGVLGPERRLGWTWTGGPDAQYTRLALTPDFQLTAWTLIVDGDETTVSLPDLMAAAAIDVLPVARYRFEILRVLNRSFDIDAYTNRGFNLYLRDSWSTGQGFFQITSP
jgi:photosystem II stability/assembly factor-like uncharacterized protein